MPVSIPLRVIGKNGTSVAVLPGRVVARYRVAVQASARSASAQQLGVS
jgi:hypothetical protein